MRQTLLGVIGFISLLSSCEALLQIKCSICPTSQEIEVRNNIANEYNCDVSVGHDKTLKRKELAII